MNNLLLWSADAGLRSALSATLVFRYRPNAQRDARTDPALRQISASSHTGTPWQAARVSQPERLISVTSLPACPSYLRWVPVFDHRALVGIHPDALNVAVVAGSAATENWSFLHDVLFANQDTPDQDSLIHPPAVMAGVSGHAARDGRRGFTQAKVYGHMLSDCRLHTAARPGKLDQTLRAATLRP